LSPSLFDKCRIDSDEYPYLAFACRISEVALEAKDVVNKESNLPFFSESDVLRAKFLKKMTGKAQETKLIQKAEHTLTALCRLRKSQEIMESGLSADMQISKNDDRDIVSMNKAVMKFFNKLSNAGLECN
ncbi:MAG: hypothetical protein KAH84_06410, partial [Thiomargarita sp.]|nr:hypothetical protein [Thiomargarita sp.]